MTDTKYILLLGAGFSRNWGGWLASEVFEYLLGCPEVDKDSLFDHKRRGGFEAALAHLQEKHAKSCPTTPDPHLINLHSALQRMFNDMNEGFGKRSFEFQECREYQVAQFLVRFDAIFTLNQDTLLERYYLNDDIPHRSNLKWNGPQLAGMRPVDTLDNPLESFYLTSFEPDPQNFKVDNRCQPYFKLHGSSNWIDTTPDGLMVLGGIKRTYIDRYPVLKWIHKQFEEALAKPNTKVMVIGYSFGDDHINSLIREAVKNDNIGLFVIDPLGIDVMDFNRNAQIPYLDELAEELWPHTIGSSRRPLRDTFGDDHVEHAKVMRFFD